MSRGLAGKAFDIAATDFHTSSGPCKVRPEDISTTSPSAVKQAPNACRSSDAAAATWERCLMRHGGDVDPRQDIHEGAPFDPRGWVKARSYCASAPKRLNRKAPCGVVVS